MSGIETIKEMNRLGRKAKIIMITAISTVQNTVEAIKPRALRLYIQTF
jgi:DNA-binding NtrC family response regulator